MFPPFTGFTIGSLGDIDAAPEKFRTRDAAPRTRKPLAALVLRERWGNSTP